MSDPRPMLDRTLYVGRYSDRFYGDAEVTTDGDRLRLRFGRRACTLEHAGGDVFRCAWEARWRGEIAVEFSPVAGALRFGAIELRRAN